jgi:hypothetical protein
VAQDTEHVLSKPETMSSNSSTFKKENLIKESQERLHSSVIPTFGRLKEKDHVFEASLIH